MSTETNDTTWIGVKEIAAEMNWTDRQAYEEVRRLGVPCRGRGRMGLRFRRADYEQRRDAALAPLEARKPYSRPTPPEAAVGSPKPAAKPSALPRRSKLRMQP
jgi:hypothetical protein